MQDNHYSEKRKYFRVTPSLSNPVLTTISDSDTIFNSLPVKDISLGGVAFYYPLDAPMLQIGKSISKMQLTLPQQGAINASGVVRRVEQDKTTPRVLYAMEFSRLPVNSDRKLYTYLNQRQREISWVTTN